MERVSYERLKVTCGRCEHPMIFESSLNDNTFIYLCELCKNEIRVKILDDNELVYA